jgi:predicted sulfurtransferase
MKLAILIFVSLETTTLMAADWMQVGKTNDVGTSFYVDTDSINGDDSLKKAWVLEDRSTTKSVKVKGKAIKYMSYKSLRVVYCDKNISSHQRGIFYSKRNGHGVDLRSYNEKFDDLVFAEAAPSTMGEAMNQFICAFDNRLKKYS